jgi:2-methylcitrate dehydratase PrpD
MIHGQDYDDTHRLGVVHSSSVVVPAALACGEAKEISGKSLMETIISGYEIFARIGMAANGGFHKKGMHATPMCGIFAASLIAGKVNSLSDKELVNALGVCGSQAAGLQQFLIDGSWAKIIHPGWAAHSGIIASKLASNGFTGPLAIFEGELGFFAAHLGLENTKLNCLTKDLGKVWQTLNISMKCYPCCHAIHTFIDGVFFLQKKHNIQWQNIKKIICIINPLGAKLVCEPIEAKRKPKTIYGARFSLPYAIAMSLLDRELGLKQFSEQRISDNQVFEITKKVVCINKDSFPRTGGNIAIEMEDGNKYHYIKEYPIGSPLNPLEEHQVLDKFRRNVSDFIPEDRAEKIIKSVLNIEDIDNIKKLMKLLK